MKGVKSANLQRTKQAFVGTSMTHASMFADGNISCVLNRVKLKANCHIIHIPKANLLGV